MLPDTGGQGQLSANLSRFGVPTVDRDTAFGGFLVQGAPRTVKASATFEF